MHEEVEEIKNDLQLADYFKEYRENRDPRVIKEIIKYVKSDKVKDIHLEIEFYADVSDYEDEEGNTLLYYLIKNSFICSYEVLNFISNNIQAVWDFLETEPKDLQYINYNTDEETFFKKLPTGVTLFSYLLKTKKLTGMIIGKIRKHPEIVEQINTYDRRKLNYLHEDLLFNTSINSTRTIDYIFKEGIVSKELISGIAFHEEIVDIILQNNRKDLLKYLNENILLKKKDDKYYLEILLDDGIVPETSMIRQEASKIFCERGLFYKLKDKYEFTLLEEVSDGKTLFEVLLDHGITPTNNYFTKEQSLLIMFKYKRFDLMTRCSIDLLLTPIEKDSDKTYFDLILEEMRYGLPFKLSDLSTYSDDVKNTALFYVKVAKMGFKNHLLSIDPVSLVTPKPIISLLDAMISIDKDTTLNIILDGRLRESFPVATYLRIHGYDNDTMEVKLFDENDLTSRYYDNLLEQYKDIKINEEDEELLNRFKELMLSDELSEEEFVDLIVINYRRLLSENNEWARGELIKLIELKESVPEFRVVRTNEYETPFYRNYDRSIHLRNNSINTLNHEMGHALYHNLTNKEVPDDFYRIVKALREDDETKDKLKAFSTFYKQQEEKITDMVNKYVEDFYKEPGDTYRLENLIYFSSEDKKKELLKYGYSEEDIEILFANINSLEEYQEEAKRINADELTDAVIRTKFGGIISIFDMIDGIYDGKYRSGELVDNNGFWIHPSYGHGMGYYERGIDWVFDETMANFSAIIKSTNARESLSLLRDILGDHFVNCVETYYRDEIVNSTKNLRRKGL